MNGTTPTPEATPPEAAPPGGAPTPGAQTPAPATVAGAQPPPVPSIPVPQPPPKKHGCRNCLFGCLSVFVLLALTVLVAVGWFLNWPAQWGLVDTPSERMFASSPDPYAGDALTAELESQGVTMTGITVYVLPSQEGTGQVAYFLVEDAKGVTWSNQTFKSPAEGLLILGAGSQAAIDYDIVRIAVDHRDSEGLQVAVMTAPRDVLWEYGAGTISQEELFEQMSGYADMAGYLASQQE